MNGPAELDALRQLLRASFELDDDELAEWLDLDEDTSVLVAALADRLVGSLHLRRHGVFLGGRAVPAASVDALAVDERHRRRGIGSALTAVAVGRMRSDGRSIGILRPASTRFYRRLGWEVAGVWILRELSAGAFAGIGTTPHVVVRRAAPSDTAAIERLHASVAADTPGWIERTPASWRRQRQGPRKRRSVHLAVDATGAPIGYAISESRSHGDRPRLHVKEVIATSREALEALWQFLAHEAAGSSLTYIGSPQDPLRFILDDPRPHVLREQAWMVRMVDVASAISARDFAAGVEGSVEFELTDRFAPWNAGRWVLRVGNARGELEPGGGGTCKLTAGSLAALFTGYASASQLRHIGSLRGSTPQDLALLDAAFRGPTPWMPDEV